MAAHYQSYIPLASAFRILKAAIVESILQSHD